LTCVALNNGAIQACDKQRTII